MQNEGFFEKDVCKKCARCSFVVSLWKEFMLNFCVFSFCSECQQLGWLEHFLLRQAENIVMYSC